MPKKVVYEYDYERITLSFRKDIEAQKNIADYIEAIPKFKRVEFFSGLITEYLREYGITSPEELTKVAKSGKMFERSKSFSDEQTREIKMLIADFIGKGALPITPSPAEKKEEVVHDEQQTKKPEPPKKENEKIEETELSSDEASVLADYMNSFG